MPDASQNTNVDDRARASLAVSPWQLMRTFALVGLCAFGGVMPWVYREVVDKQKWVDDQQFAELWGQSLLLPGATSVNVAATLGYRLTGLQGAAAAVAGLLGPPFVLVIFMTIAYQHYGMFPAVNGAIRGVTAVAAGLVIATGLKLALGQPRRLTLPVFSAAALVAVLVLQWQLIAVIGALLPLAFIFEWRACR